MGTLDAGVALPTDSFNSTLSALAKAGDWLTAAQLVDAMLVRPPPKSNVRIMAYKCM